MIEDRDGQPDFVKVLDFGIAKVFDASRVAHAIKTATGLKMGAPAYMSPERMSKKRELTPSSDLYSVAVVIGEMLKGEPLYGKRNSVQIFASQLSGEPIPFPERIRGTRLGAVLEKATQEDIEDRYQSTQEMLAAIDELLRHPKHMLGPAGMPIPAERSGLTTPLWVALLVFLVVALAAVLLVLLT
jgi:serine/threonine-protein kinase